MRRIRREFIAEKSAIPEVHDFVKAELDRHGIEQSKRDDIVLACDEAASNIIEHAFRRDGLITATKRTFVLALQCHKNRVTVTFFDAGAPFDMQKVEHPDIRRNLAGEKRGGYGIFLIRKLVDKMVYSARRRMNVTRLVITVSG